jgi:hypothetical protein
MLSAQVKNAFVSIGEVDPSLLPGSLVLKVGISTQHIRYFVQSVSHNQIIFYGEYTLHHVGSVIELCQRIEKIFEKDENLQIPFGKTYIGIDSPYALLPDAFTFPTKEPNNSFIQSIARLGINMSYQIDDMLAAKLASLFSNQSVVHINSSLLTSLPGFIEKGQPKVFVNIEQNHFDILAFTETGSLQIMNRYEFKTQNDFIYFLLLACDQLNIDREKTELVLSGQVDIESKIYDVCYRYFRFISFIRTPDNVHFSRAFDIFPKHLHFNLYNLGA